MTSLYVYDFDKTLVPYDSFRRYLIHLLWLRPVRIGVLLLLRKLRLISSWKLKARVTMMVECSESLSKDAKSFALDIVRDINDERITVNGVGKVLVITASPKVYMTYVAEEMGWDMVCSEMRCGEYVEMCGKKKKEALAERYPKLEYEYMFAASDSESDLCWMKEFKKYEIVGESSGIRY